MASYLPGGHGWLPTWLIFTSVLSIGNSLQAYLTTSFTARVYAAANSATSSKPSSAPAEVTPLQSRTFGTWTLLSSVIRLYAAYKITDPMVYQLALWTYGIAWGHFMSEWLVFGTAEWGKGLAGPVIVATGSLTWMGTQWGNYVQ